MGVVAIGWEVYALTHSALALGLVGLAQFLPTLLFTLIAGHVADRYDRRRIVFLCQLAQTAAALCLAWGSFGGRLATPAIYAAVTVFGTAIAFEAPAMAALLPNVTPQGQVQRASAVITTAFQIAIIGGPALGGVLYAIAPGLPYLVMSALWIAASLAALAVRTPGSAPSSGDPVNWKTILAGFTFVRAAPEILGTISLDLFAVLLGGATALLPIYAKDILHTGPWGLGVLRSAPAVGALVMGGILANRPLTRRAGLRMFQAVIAFGLATIAFSLSHWFWFTVVALALMGAADTVSVVIRLALVQLATPDAMRGRVGAVNYLFVNASNQLGEFESGVVASLIGAVPAAALGGAGTIIVAFIWMHLFPKLKHWDHLG